MVGGFSFYQRAEVKDIVAYLKLALSPHDAVSFNRVLNVPARGIGKSTADQAILVKSLRVVGGPGNSLFKKPTGE